MSSETEQAKLTGKEVANYVLTEKLGRGNLTEVWKAHHQVLNTDVVIEFLVDGLAGLPEVEERFFNEGKKQGRLFHPNIASAYDFLKIDGRTYIVRKFIVGESLHGVLSRGLLPLEKALGITTDVLHALDYAHSQRMLHGDLKPSSILLERSGKALVLDFGMALVTRPPGLTVSSAAGDFPYMSPEQLAGSGPVDGRADIYSLGCVLYQMLTGKMAYDRALTESAARKPAPLQQWNPRIPVYLDAVVQRCIEKDPAARFASCKEVLQALQAPPLENIPTPHSIPGRTTTIEPVEPLPAQPPVPLLQPRSPVTPRPVPHPPTEVISPPVPVAVTPPPIAPRPTPIPPKPVAVPSRPSAAPQKDSAVLWIICTALLSGAAIGGFYWFTHRQKPEPAPIVTPNPVSPGPDAGTPKPSPGQTDQSNKQPDLPQPPVDHTPDTNPPPVQPGPNNPGEPTPQQPAPRQPAPQPQTPAPAPDSGPSTIPVQPAPAPTPAPSTPNPRARNYAKEGNLIWSGVVDKDQVIQITGSSANIGRVAGDPFPGGVPIQISVSNNRFAVVSQPNPLNQFSQVSLRSTMKGNIEVTIHWTVLPSE